MSAEAAGHRSFESLLASWGGDQVVIRFLPRWGSWLFIAMHSRVLGPATGGSRLSTYPTSVDGLHDALRLAEAMTIKLAIAGMPCGGGKAVLAVPALPAGAVREQLLTAYAETLASLGGRFQTGPDLNTTSSDMDLLARWSPHVFCRTEANGGSGDSGRHTARGVVHAIRTSLRHVFGSPVLTGRTVLVQGLGSVGAHVAQLAAADGARVLVSDVDAARVRGIAHGVGAVPVAPADVIGSECDVYAPCALGGVLTVDTIPRLRCRIVAGAANNQLGVPEDAERLRQAGVLYAPDFVCNAGGVLHAIGSEALGWSPARTEAAIASIGDRLASIFMRADLDRVSTDRAARVIAAQHLHAGPPRSDGAHPAGASS